MSCDDTWIIFIVYTITVKDSWMTALRSDLYTDQ